MRYENEFYNFLLSEKTISSEKAIRSRMSKARKAEQVLNLTLDAVVADDDLMYKSLAMLSQHEDPAHAPMQNALRKYYKFINNKEFPRMKNFKH